MKKLIILLPVLVTLGMYLPQLGNQYVQFDYDAYEYVLHSETYGQTALSLLTDIRGQIVSGYYAPLSSISLMFDKTMTLGWVSPPRMTLFVNLMLHCLNGVLVFTLVRTAGAPYAGAWLAAFIFLVHPAQVPSVVWFAQRKGLMAGAFFLAAYITYLQFRKDRATVRYVACAGLFVAGLLSKPSAIVLPACLLWTEIVSLSAAPPGQEDRGKICAADSEDRGECARVTKAPVLRVPSLDVLAALLPLFAISLGFAALTLASEAPQGEPVPLADRPFIAAAAIWSYVGTVLIPVDLLPVYPKWNIDTSSLRWWIPLGATICAVALIFRFRRLVGKELLWAIGNSIIPLLPVLGFFSFAYFHLAFVADHFLYLPMIGFAHAVAHIAERLRNRWSRPMGSIVAAALAAYLVFLSVQTVQRVGVWTNSVTLWTRAVHGNPGNWKIHTFLGHALVAEGRHEEALKEFRLALAQNLSELARVNRWGIEMGGDSDREGLQSLGRSQAELRRQVASAHYNVALALLRMSETNGAREHLKKALRQRPEFVKALNNLAATYLMEGRPRDAIPWLGRAISIEADNAELHRNLAVAFAATGEEARARRHFEKAQELQRVLGRSKR